MNGDTVKKAVKHPATITIGGVTVSMSLVIGVIVWATNEVANIKIDHKQIDGNTQAVREVKIDIADIKTTQQILERRIAINENDKKHIMEDLKKNYSEIKESNKRMEKFLERILNGD